MTGLLYLLIAIPLGTCEKARAVNRGSQKHVAFECRKNQTQAVDE